MTNVGVITNSRLGQPSYFKPEVLCAANGAVTHPTFPERISGQAHINYGFGRWSIDEDRIVTVEMQTQFIDDATLGSGSAYVWRLPVPARRAKGYGSDPTPIGEGMCYWSTVAPFSNVTCIATLADPWTSLGGNEDSYCQLYAPWRLDWGTFTIASGATTAVVNHRSGYAFSESDLEVLIPAGDTGLLTTKPWLLANSISSTQVTFGVRVATDAATDSIGYKVRGEPPTGQGGANVSPTVPWDWSRFDPATGPFGNIFLQLSYPAA